MIGNIGGTFRMAAAGEHIEHRTGGRGSGKTALQGAGENGFQPEEICDLGADLAQMDRRQDLHLGARCPARFGKNEQFLDLADGKADLARAADKGQPFDMLRPIVPVIGCGPGRFRHQADAFIISHRLQMDPRSLRERSDGQRSHVCDSCLLDPVVTTDLITFPEIEEAMMNAQHDDPAIGTAPSRQATDPSATAMRLTAIGGILGAIAASSCCIAPLVLFSVGVSGAWIGNLTALAPYQPYFIAATLACLGYGYWLVYRRNKIACAEAACARRLPNHIVKAVLVLATILVAGAIAFDVFAPLLLNS